MHLSRDQKRERDPALLASDEFRISERRLIATYNVIKVQKQLVKNNKNGLYIFGYKT